MVLTQDLINQFVKLTDKEEKPKEVTVNGTYRMINGEEYVQIDGSEIWTPVTSTVEAETGERVKVMIKNHTATVTGNISSPSARSKSVQDLKDEVDEQGNTIEQLDNTIEQQGNSIIQIDNDIKQVNNDILQANNAINQQGNVIRQLGNEINQQGDIINSMNNDITANSNEITAINNTIVQQNNTITQHGNVIEQQGNIISQQGNIINQHGNEIDQLDNDINQQGNTITQINNKIDQQDNVIQQQGNIISQQGNIIDQQDNIITEHGNNILILNSGFQIVDGVLTGLNQAVINELETNHLDARYATIDGLDAQYAHINFANINYEAVTKIFADSGIIDNLIVDDQHITGKLVGVTIVGDLIEGNTIKADKLVIRGNDGLYYKLNTNGETVESEQTAENSLNGQMIAANTITASKINVDDLVAFGATIGGFNISDNAIYSGVKASVDNTTPGVYMDKDGQIAIGDEDNHIKFYYDESADKHRLEISTEDIVIGDKTLQEKFNDIEDGQNQIVLGVKGKGGNNLLYNSVMYAIDRTTGIPLNWTISGEGSLNPHTADSNAISKGCLSGNVFTISNKVVKQRVIVQQWDETNENNTAYSFSCKLNKGATGKAYIKIYNNVEGPNDHVIEINDETDYETFKIEDLHPMANYYDIEFVATADAEVSITDVMFSAGDMISQWMQANGEIMNAYVVINNEGLDVSSRNGQNYTVVTPEKFAGYSKTESADYEEVFNINGAETDVKKLKARTQITMDPIKILPVKSSLREGWAWVKYDETVG